MSVRIIILPMFRDAAGGETEVSLDGCETVGDCLKALRSRFPDLGKMLFDEGDSVSGSLNVLVNGQSAGEPDGIAGFPVQDGDELCPLMMIGGG